MRALLFAAALAVVPFGTALHAGQPTSGVDAAPAAAMQVDVRTGDSKPADPGPAATKPAETGSADAGKALADHAKRIDALFAALQAAPTKESAKAIADRLDVALLPSGSDTADVLMSRAAVATEAKNYDLALQLLDGVLLVAPDHLEAWNKRATVYYLKQDFADSLADLRQVVAREPRHYGAWAGIALICKEIGDDKHALEAARRALAIYPLLDQIGDMEKSLAISVEGRPI